jgi:hypothetical protein
MKTETRAKNFATTRRYVCTYNRRHREYDVGHATQVDNGTICIPAYCFIWHIVSWMANVHT